MRGLLLGLFLFAIGGAALAGTASERLFARAALNGISDGAAITYDHAREIAPGGPVKPLTNGEIRISIHLSETGERETALAMGPAGKVRPKSTFPASSGNPLVPIFLESALRTMATVTGGSKFYIRNRIKEALGSGGAMEDVELEMNGTNVPALHIVFRPFANDKNRDRMGAFADLKLHFYVSEAVPGDVVKFLATTGGETGEVGYRETITFRAVKEPN